MKRLLILFIALYSIQSLNNLSANEFGFSKKFNGEYILIEEKLAVETVMNCKKEINLKVEDGILEIDDSELIEFYNGCTGNEESNTCKISSPTRYKSNHNYRDFQYEGHEGIINTDTTVIELTGVKKDTFKMHYSQGKISLFQKASPFDYKCTYKRK